MNIFEKLMLHFGYVKADLLIQEEKDKQYWEKSFNTVSSTLERVKKKHEILQTKYNALGLDKKEEKEKDCLDKNKLQNWATQVKQRDGKCQVCDITENLSAHHLFSKNDYPNVAYELDNGVTMCVECHNKFHKQYPQRCIPKNFDKFKILEQGGFN